MKNLLYPHWAIVPVEFVRTRANLRLAEREYRMIYKKLNDVELRFGKELEKEEVSDDIFNKYNQEWNKACQEIIKSNPKCWGVDFKYFVNVYKNQ